MSRPDDEFYKILGSTLQKIRNSKHLSTRQVAEKMGSKTSKSTVSNYENGSPALSNRVKLNSICNALGVDADEVWAQASDEWSEAKWQAMEPARQRSKKLLSLSDEEAQIAFDYRSLTPTNKEACRSYIDYLKSRQ